MTGLPFVFATWVSNKKLPAGFIDEFNNVNEIGLKAIDVIVQQQQHPLYNLHKYYTENISYRLDEEKEKGMQLFLQKAVFINNIK